MRKLVISAFALAAMTSVAMAAEPVKLTSSQLDLVAAGNPCSFLASTHLHPNKRHETDGGG